MQPLSSRFTWTLIGAGLLASLGPGPAMLVGVATGNAADEKADIKLAKVAQARQQGVEFLRTTQNGDGWWTSATAPDGR
jgi:hypothetical protein